VGHAEKALRVGAIPGAKKIRSRADNVLLAPREKSSESICGAGETELSMDRAAALALLKDVLADTVRADGPDLNARQAAILLRVSLEPGPHTVRGLAEALSLGKPAVSRALDALGGYGLAVSLPDEADKRSVIVQTTARGLAMLANLADRVVACERQRNIAVHKTMVGPTSHAA
jgi:DNA-binding MarR family transcriptional regulator